MKAAELRDLGADELGAKERDLTDQLFRLRIQKSMGQLEAPAKLRSVRRDLARVKTFEAAYALGNTHLDLNHQDRARQSYELAITLTDKPQAGDHVASRILGGA